MTEVSLVLPAYNEAQRIEDTVRRTAEALSKITDSFEIIIAEDGSQDGTAEIAQRLVEELPYVTHFHSDERLGRGRALNRAFKASKGDILAYIDVDLATDMGHLRELIDAVRVDGYDMATGSRMLPDSMVRRSTGRRVASLGFNFLTRFFLRSSLCDHQCGFKSFRREALMSIIDDVEDTHWFWDTETLVRAQLLGYRVKEFPVKWTHSGTTTVDLRRDVVGMGSQIMRLWWQLRVRGGGRRGGLVASALLAVFILAIIATFVGVRDLLTTIYSASPLLILAAVGVYIVSWPVRGWRYRSILVRVGHRESLGFLTGIIFISQTANIVLPARIGDAARAYLLKRERGIPLTSGFSTLALERVFDVIAITAVGALALLHSSQIVALPPWIANSLAAGGIIAAFAVVAAVMLSASSGRLITRIARGRGDRVAQITQRFFDEMRIVSTHPRSFLVIFTSSLVIWAIDIFTCILVLQAFGYEPLVSLVFLAVAVGNLAKTFPVTPGGIGTYEAVLTAIFSLGGLHYSAAFAAAVIDHLVKNIVTLVFGGAYLSHLHLGWADLMSSDALDKAE